MGLFQDENQAADAVRSLQASDFEVLKVHSPIPGHRIAQALGLKKSRVGLFTLAGGIVGFFAGFFLAIFTAMRWDIMVGGKPVIALVPFVIVGFEFTILFAVFGNILGFLFLSDMPRGYAPG
jgi:molybdopterin-containing oxidoreductase family membrane subunit